VQQNQDVRRPELITVRVDPPPPAAPERGIPVWIRRLALTLLLAPLGAFLGLGAIAGLVLGAGTVQVRGAADDLAEQQEALSVEIQREAGLRSDLVALGADLGPLEDAFLRWEEATGEPDRTDAALEYLLLAEQEAQRHVAIDARSHEEVLVQQRLERLRKRRKTLMEAEEQWNAAVRSPHGRVAVALGLAK
jgi:hypothetical protein